MMIGNITAALARKLAAKTERLNRVFPRSTSWGTARPIGSVSNARLVKMPLQAVSGDPVLFARWSYLQRGEQPPPATEAPPQQPPVSGTARPAQPQLDNTMGRVASALAMGADPRRPPEPSSSQPAERPYKELVAQFTKAVGQYAMAPKAKQDAPETKRELRRVAAEVRRRSPLKSPKRIAARDAAVVARPTPEERREWAESHPPAPQPQETPQGQDGRPSPAAQPQRQRMGFLDTVQTAMDLVGIVDPTPLTDWSNAAISLGRAAVDPERRREHLQNAGISAVSGAVPYAGDAAKLLKLPRFVRRASGANRSGPAASAVPTMSEQLFESAVGRAFGPTARTRWNAYRKRRREEHAATAGAGGGNGGRGGGPRVATGAGGPGDEGPRRSPFGWLTAWTTQSGSPRYEQRRDDARGREKVDKAMDSFTDKLKEGAKGLAKIAVVAVGAFEGLRLFNAGVIDRNRDLAQYNGRIATAYGQYRADEIRRSIRAGEAVDEPLSGLVKGQSRLQDLRQSFTDPLKKVGLTIEEKFTNGAATFLEAGDKFTGASNTMEKAANVISAAVNLNLKGMQDAWNGQDKADDAKGTAWRTFFDDVADGQLDGKRPTFDGRGERPLMNDKDRREVFGRSVRTRKG